MSPINTDPINTKKNLQRLRYYTRHYGLYTLLIALGIGLSLRLHNPFANKDIMTIIVEQTYPLTACVRIQGKNGNAQWVAELFQKIDYKMPLKNATVPPLFLTHMPNNMDSLNSAERDRLLIQILLPSLIEASRPILAQQEELNRLRIKMNDVSASREEEIWLRNLANEYNVRIPGETFWDYKSIIEELTKKVDIIPYQITLAMIIEATDGGTDIPLVMANQLFGNSKTTIRKPFASSKNFASITLAIQDLYWKVNTFKKYERLREKRVTLRTGKEFSRNDWLAYLATTKKEGVAYSNALARAIDKYKLNQYTDALTLSDKRQSVCIMFQNTPTF